MIPGHRDDSVVNGPDGEADEVEFFGAADDGGDVVNGSLRLRSRTEPAKDETEDGGIVDKYCGRQTPEIEVGIRPVIFVFVSVEIVVNRAAK